jgi:hypothetical protein
MVLVMSTKTLRESAPAAALKGGPAPGGLGNTAAYGGGRFTFFTADVGAALCARSGLDADPRFPTMDVW